MNNGIIKYSIHLIWIFLFACGAPKGIKPETKDIKELVFASGTINWDDAYNLTAQTDGILADVRFDVGDTVSTGDILATIDNQMNVVNTQSAKQLLSISAKNVSADGPALKQLEQNILAAENKYNEDKIQYERHASLIKINAVSQVAYENSKLAAENSLLQLNALKDQYQLLLLQAQQQYINSNNQFKNSEIILGYNKLMVPQGGSVIKQLKFKGDYVRKGDIIAIIANPNNVEAVLNVDENSIGKIKPGQTVFIKLNTSKEKNINGIISEIIPAFDEKTQSFICKVKFTEPVEMNLYGTQLEANVLVGEKKNALLIPRTYMGYGNKVRVKGKDKPVIVKPGIISTEFVEILEGISANDVILPIKP